MEKELKISSNSNEILAYLETEFIWPRSQENWGYFSSTGRLPSCNKNSIWIPREWLCVSYVSIQTPKDSIRKLTRLQHSSRNNFLALRLLFSTSLSPSMTLFKILQTMGFEPVVAAVGGGGQGCDRGFVSGVSWRQTGDDRCTLVAAGGSGKGKVNTLRLGPFLYRAALRGDWKAAKTALSLDRTIACIEITERGDRALHIAAAAKQTAFVHNLVEHLNTNDLELVDKHGNTAFCFAAVSGVVEIAKVMYEKNKNLPTIRSSKCI
ncbi:Ankyrin repeat region domain-containing protein [Forsythia ovata]|uniref:Ankyrin repeat region domain-containing protein n=1 Tax=Forsythia ovata TaxID=205694 RepID=A0ABD1WHT6_9LAMI